MIAKIVLPKYPFSCHIWRLPTNRKRTGPRSLLESVCKACEYVDYHYMNFTTGCTAFSSDCDITKAPARLGSYATSILNIPEPRL